MSRETFDIPNIGSNKFLKVTPNLFTPERLNLFDDVDLYLTLIKASKCVEQGERLHNISWRILNKALLKEHNINRPKKRDGVKNIYYVLNPNNKQQIKPKSVAVKQSPLKNASVPPTTVKQNVLARPMTSPAIAQGAHDRYVDNSNITNNDVKNDFISSRQYSKSTASGLFSSFTDKYQKMKNVNHIPKKEEPQTIITGFDTSTVITKKPLPPRRSRSPFQHVRDMSMNSIDNETSKSTSPNFENAGSRKSSLPQKESLFGRPRSYKNDQNGQLSLSKASSRKGKNKIFFSSEDEDSDWDSVSDDSEFYADEDDEDYDDYNEEEADQYYRRQWDKLLFAKNQQNLDSRKSSVSSTNTINSNTSHDPVRRSLLSGLFLSEANNGSGSNNHNNAHNEFNSRNASPIPQLSHSNTGSQPQQNLANANGMKQQKPSLKTSNVTALASLSPQQGTNIGRLPMEIQKDFKSNSGSNHPYESNAPLTAQTILPTALSTHMFLPNNIHQQRMAMATGMNQRHRFPRRESMDIPSKNRNTGFLKTRMEISEEEKMVRTISRFGNTNAADNNENGDDGAAKQSKQETLEATEDSTARI
ncbi:hypothetical protein SEUBUCD646_0N02420 [Saccharomyces eubayanus]|uniref:Pleiotropic negative transcriptional regulator n=2 Tax=Saccharomyces TaxID=4930 RepID=A0A6C1EEJ7_SACPS|nr:Pleiotropic negative transcriptional regulator [Saccharomyces pastorianus]CAI1685010.1 hypothetical protein SEUBUCD650_0N02410 [Saccharomyces eubayanus]CAI1717675.1 hypothetical protein SEUBUCD646_0N02420 [Saccharomyces eubayanus]